MSRTHAVELFDQPTPPKVKSIVITLVSGGARVAVHEDGELEPFVGYKCEQADPELLYRQLCDVLAEVLPCNPEDCE